MECDRPKRDWLKATSAPTLLCDDVTKLNEPSIYNYIDDTQTVIPPRFLCYTFGYSCKDLSTLNNSSSSWKDSCLTDGKGSTGKTWRGNMDMVKQTRPLWLLMENVVAARKGKHFERLNEDLTNEGYLCMDVELNAQESGLPQDRQRAYFSAIDMGIASSSTDPFQFSALVDEMKLPDCLPLERFLLPRGHPYLEKIMESRQQAAEKKMQRVVMKRPASGKLKKRSGKKWVRDHWHVRRTLDMLAPAAMCPPHLEQIAHQNDMSSREADIMRIMFDQQSGAVTSRGGQPCRELKHSAPRVVKMLKKQSKGQASRGRRRSGATSCLLPASRLLLLPPYVEAPRFMTGLEALSIQGIERIHMQMYNGKDSLYMSLAGNAFSGGSYALMFLATLASVTLTAEVLQDL